MKTANKFIKIPKNTARDPRKLVSNVLFTNARQTLVTSKSDTSKFTQSLYQKLKVEQQLKMEEVKNQRQVFSIPRVR